jgi:hypothetical protein
MIHRLYLQVTMIPKLCFYFLISIQYSKNNFLHTLLYSYDAAIKNYKLIIAETIVHFNQNRFPLVKIRHNFKDAHCHHVCNC